MQGFARGLQLGRPNASWSGSDINNWINGKLQRFPTLMTDQVQKSESWRCGNPSVKSGLVDPPDGSQSASAIISSMQTAIN